MNLFHRFKYIILKFEFHKGREMEKMDETGI